MNPLFDKFCDNIGCEYYIEWEWDFAENAPPYPCVSCRIVGQSCNIDQYPETCPHLDEIKEFEKDWEKNRMWEKLNDIT